MIRTFAAILLAALSIGARAQTCSLTPADLQLLLTQSGQDIVESYTGIGASNATLTAQVTTLQQQVADLQAKLAACSGGNPPPPPPPPPPSGTVPTGFDLDAAAIASAPVNAFARLWPGPDQTFYNTEWGTLPGGGFAMPGSVGVEECTTRAVEKPVPIAVPLGGGFMMPTVGPGKILYFGGGHSGYMSNRAFEYDIATGRWSQSTYTPDIGCWVTGAIGPRQPTAPGNGPPYVNAAGNALISGTPNGSAGGRGWWEHTDNRIAFDKRLGGWLMVQNSGTWLYKHNGGAGTWQQLRGPWPIGDSMMCGPGDYTAMGVVWREQDQSTYAWCSSEHIFRWNYTTSDWDYLHTLNPFDRNPQTDILSQATVGPGGRIYMFRMQTTSLYTAATTNPWLQWYDPVTNTSGKLDTTRPHHPQGQQVARDINTFNPVNPNDPCLTQPCQVAYPTLVHDPVNDTLLVAGRRAGDGRLIIWRLRNVLTAAEQWEVIDAELTDAPKIEQKHFGLGLFAYIPERDAFLLTLRIGSGSGGGSTRNAAECADAPGVVGDCFKMYGFRLSR